MEQKRGFFISFEGGEGIGKSTQVKLLSQRLNDWGHTVRVLREPGGTPIGEEIRHTLKHSKVNDAMTWETELLLMNASRAQLVREVIRPAMAQGEIIICDRFYDSTTAYQGYGRKLDLDMVKKVIDVAVGDTRPDLTFYWEAPPELAAQNLTERNAGLPFVRDRIEEADRTFFERVRAGYEEIAKQEHHRFRVLEYHHGEEGKERMRRDIWERVVAHIKGYDDGIYLAKRN